MAAEKGANLMQMVQEHSWRGRCLRTWVLLVGFAAFAAAEGDWSALRFALTPIMIGGFELLYWLDARSKRYDLREIAGRAGYRLGRVFRKRNA